MPTTENMGFEDRLQRNHDHARNMAARAKAAECMRQIIFEEAADVYDGSIAVGFEMHSQPNGVRLSYEAAEIIMRLLKD